MDSTGSRKPSGSFTPRPRSVGSRVGSSHTSRAASPTRLQRSSTTASTVTDNEVAKMLALAPLPQATTWAPTQESGRSILVGKTQPQDSDDSKTPSLEIIEPGKSIKDRYGAVIEIPVSKKIVFQGIADICVLQGTVSVYEYTMAAGSYQWTRVYSPSSHPLVSICAIPQAAKPKWKTEDVAQTPESDILEIQELWNKYGTLEDLARPISKSAAVVAIRSVSCGLELIDTMAPLYKGMFMLDPIYLRIISGLPKNPAKRKLGISRSESTAKLQRANNSSTSLSKSAVDTDNSVASEGGDAGSEAESEMVQIDSGNNEASRLEEYVAAEESLRVHIGLPGFNPISHITVDLQMLQAPSDWTDALDRASVSAVQLDEVFEPIPPVYVVAGQQGQGKSTFSRKLVNRLISRFGRLFYIETDLGQPEVSPNGTLSLTMLENPLLGPPFTHMSQFEPYHAVYMGVTSPKNDPDRYVKGIQRLVSVYRDHALKRTSKDQADAGSGNNDLAFGSAAELDRQVIPLVVNTQGWLKGLGLDLHYSLCEAVRPTNYIQLYDLNNVQEQQQQQPTGLEVTGQGRNSMDSIGPKIDFSTIPGRDPHIAMISGMSFDRASQVLLENAAAASGAPDSSTEITASALVGEPAVRRVSRITQRDQRYLSMMSHLYLTSKFTVEQTWNPALRKIDTPCWNMQTSLASQRPIVVPWSDLVFWLGEEDVPPSQMLRALNGSIVGVIAVASAPSSMAHVWTSAEVRGLYAGGKGISNHAAVQLSGPGSRVLLYSKSDEKHQEDGLGLNAGQLPPFPQIVYGNPNPDNTTFLAHALVRSVNPVEGTVHLLLPPLITKRNLTSPTDSSALHPINRIVGIAKGPGPNVFGVELPVWAMVDGGYADRAIGSAALASRSKKYGKKTKNKAADGQSETVGNVVLGIKEVPYLSVDQDSGIGALSASTRPTLLRRGFQ
ncbi:Polynucleotide 5'-hydroxyl-kinase grc3 [Coemansia sp. Benny D115]|nr:Polynucleotide 5'-hydroxyl-kinase grc3 [Coemansia sp. Benny D115]